MNGAWILTSQFRESGNQNNRSGKSRIRRHSSGPFLFLSLVFPSFFVLFRIFRLLHFPNGQMLFGFPRVPLQNDLQNPGTIKVRGIPVPSSSSAHPTGDLCPLFFFALRQYLFLSLSLIKSLSLCSLFFDTKLSLFPHRGGHLLLLLGSIHANVCVWHWHQFLILWPSPPSLLLFHSLHLSLSLFVPITFHIFPLLFPKNILLLLPFPFFWIQILPHCSAAKALKSTVLFCPKGRRQKHLFDLSESAKVARNWGGGEGPPKKFQIWPFSRPLTPSI